MITTKLEPINEWVVSAVSNLDRDQCGSDGVSRGASTAVVWNPTRATNSPSALNASPSARHPHPLRKLAMNYRRLMLPSRPRHECSSDADNRGASTAVVWNPTRATNSPSALNASPSARHPHPLRTLAMNYRRLMLPSVRAVEVNGLDGEPVTRK